MRKVKCIVKRFTILIQFVWKLEKIKITIHAYKLHDKIFYYDVLFIFDKVVSKISFYEYEKVLDK